MFRDPNPSDLRPIDNGTEVVRWDGWAEVGCADFLDPKTRIELLPVFVILTDKQILHCVRDDEISSPRWVAMHVDLMRLIDWFQFSRFVPRYVPR